jgi:hypothetical protein
MKHKYLQRENVVSFFNRANPAQSVSIVICTFGFPLGFLQSPDYCSKLAVFLSHPKPQFFCQATISLIITLSLNLFAI